MMDYKLSKEDSAALSELRAMCPEPVREIRVRKDLFEAVEDVLSRIPEYDKESGEMVPMNVLFASTHHREANFMFRGTVVMMEQDAPV